MSLLLKQVYQLLGIRAIKITPYHPQTDGLVERFNQTLKSTLASSFPSQGPTGTNGYLIFCLLTERCHRLPQVSLHLNCYMVGR